MQPTTVLPLWPGGAPGSEGWQQVESEFLRPDGMPGVRNVVQPSLTVYHPDPANATGAAVVVCPGGAFHFLAIDHEGVKVAEWLAARGGTACILRYRLIATGEDFEADINANMGSRKRFGKLMDDLYPLILADGQQAIRLVRQHAAEWGVDPQRVGMMGFSAGGAVTTFVAIQHTPDSRPDFAAPIYAGVHEKVSAPPDAPPLFLLCANDDDMATRASLWLYKAWNDAKRPVEMHIYASGGHGFGMYKKGLPSDTWIERFYDWMGAIGMLKG